MNTFPELEVKKDSESQLLKKTELIKKEQEGFIIETEGHYTTAKERLITATKLSKQIHETFDPIVKKAHETHKEATSQRKKFLDPAEAAKSFYQRLIGDYDYKKEQARLAEIKKINDARIAKEEAANKKKAAKLEKAGFAEEAEAVREAEAEVEVVMVSTEKEVDSDVKYRDNWKAEVTDLSKVPRDYLVADMSKLDKMAKAFKADSTIPGVKFVNRRIAMTR